MATTPRTIRWTSRRASSYLELIRHRLGVQEGDRMRLDHLGTLRQASAALEPAGWRFLERLDVVVTVPADASSVALPADCREVLGVQREGLELYETHPSTTQGISDLRSDALPVELNRYHVARWALNTEGDGYEPVLEVYPTPSSEVELRVLYRAQLPRPREDNDVVVLPDWFEPLYEFTVLELAEARERPELGNVAARWELIRRSELFRTAKASDGSIASTSMPLGYGAIGAERLRSRALRGPGMAGIGTYVVEP